ncbi:MULTISPECIES: DUF4365 domain-containing protein [Yersinia]|uniref:DUF4365 domain-containing protein n=1 Tax=Yersinia TaxID=629 RepID=UPI000BFBD52D|nr:MULTISPECIES: DUF4365 domain-containing protein [Yersinia]ATM87935.1 hypothetical protein CRN74_18765 [Yersinia frederiksenii]MCB5318771.1 DUF4365 domain-containing protein [Yersinia massiliensis]
MTKKSRIDVNHQGQLGVAWVQWIVEGLWNAGLEIISAHNDDGIDALVLLKRRKNTSYAGPTGDMIFAQIKTGYVTQNPLVDYSIVLGKNYLKSHLPRWLSYPGPVVMINVIPPRYTGGQPIAYWTNIRTHFFDESTYKVDFSLNNKFDLSAKSDFFNMCWRWAELRQLPILRAESKLPFELDEINIKSVAKNTDNLLITAKSYYGKWKDAAKKNPDLFCVAITWRGWKHLTRFSRPNATKHQSLLLLPVALRMLLKNAKVVRTTLSKKNQTNLDCGQSRIRWYDAITARVTFYERHEAVIRVVIECTVLEYQGKAKYREDCFYSLHELARRKSFS